jgi:hypothetical protein
MQRALAPAEALASGRVRIDGSEEDFAQCVDLPPGPEGRGRQFLKRAASSEPPVASPSL